MQDRELAAEVVDRLNSLVGDDGVREVIGTLIEQRVPVDPSLADHPTIQVGEEGGSFRLGVLGLLNGICGARSNAWGYVTAVFSDSGELERFELLG